MASLDASPYEAVFIATPITTPRQRRLSCTVDYDGHSHEMCILVHIPGGILKLYPRDPSLLKEMVYKDRDTPK